MLQEHLLLAMAITPTDQTVQVSKGTKLDVNNFAGDVIVKVWDSDAVRVEVQPLRSRGGRHQAGRADADDPVALGARRSAALARLHDHACRNGWRSASAAPTPT